MNEEKTTQIRKWVLIGCLGLGLLSIVGIFFSLSSESSLQFWSDVALRLTYLYVLGAMGLIVSFAAYKLVKNYRDNKNFLFGLAGVIVLWLLGRMVSSERLLASPKLLDELEIKYGATVSSVVKNVDATLYLTYFLLLLAIGAVLYNSIASIFRK